MPDGGRRLYIHDNRMLDIDQKSASVSHGLMLAIGAKPDIDVKDIRFCLLCCGRRPLCGIEVP